MVQQTQVPEWMTDTDELPVIKGPGNGVSLNGDESETGVIVAGPGAEARTEVIPTIERGETEALPKLQPQSPRGGAPSLPGLESIRSHAGLIALGALALLIVLATVVFGGSGSSQGSGEELDLPNVEAPSGDAEEPSAPVEEEQAAEEEQRKQEEEGPSGESEQPLSDPVPQPEPPPQEPAPVALPPTEPPGVTPASGGVNP